MDHVAHDFERRMVKLEKQLKLYQTVLLLLFAGIGFFFFSGSKSTVKSQYVTELNVERINIVEPDGKLALVLANSARMPEPLINGKTVEIGRKGKYGGLIFYDGKGWEVGGLIYGTIIKDDSSYIAGSHLSFDQFRNDQVVYLDYQDNGTYKAAGLYVVDRARKPTIDEILQIQSKIERTSEEERSALEKKLENIGAPRLFVGSEDDTAMVRLRDIKGRERLRLAVSPEGKAQLLFFDEKGNVIYKLPK